MEQLMNYIEIVRIADIEQVMTGQNRRIVDFKLKNGQEKFCFLTDKELKLTIKPKEKDGNRSFDIALKAFAGLSKEDVDKLSERLAIVGITDDKQTYYIGTADFPATVTLLPDLNTCEIDVACEALIPIF